MQEQVNSTATVRRQKMVTWRGHDLPSLESARLVLAEGLRFRGTGRLIVAANTETGAFSASYEVGVNEAGEVKRLLVRSTTAEHERQISFSRSHDGFWLYDRGQGPQREEFQGAAEVDVQFCVLFNTLPIRRHQLHREAGEATMPVLWVSLPELELKVVHQTYRTVSAGEQESVVNFSHLGFTADITVCEDAVVLDYPGISGRI
ncbi:putative glycolipid-binding domain-containing protein [Crossiella sp. CA-258035]|uniref:putative glycolipid-binding domain-containing protein n=1 Tax=Crossiella sp. CA-258035 TaxID=2981138 RepID=UPI0024BC1933|nr:putative glycolipid-binding domain-containing protein [Crossiella sp. CA-258035]WHT19708.1 putative glycolipid-binding domain-containing protein [Crossiella sp. CA-258035]